MGCNLVNECIARSCCHVFCLNVIFQKNVFEALTYVDGKPIQWLHVWDITAEGRT